MGKSEKIGKKFLKSEKFIFSQSEIVLGHAPAPPPLSQKISDMWQSSLKVWSCSSFE